jgi:putative SOS response-associated peptidase YedK
MSGRRRRGGLRGDTTIAASPASTMVMTEACHHIAGVHDRIPVILKREDWLS